MEWAANAFSSPSRLANRARALVASVLSPPPGPLLPVLSAPLPLPMSASSAAAAAASPPPTQGELDAIERCNEQWDETPIELRLHNPSLLKVLRAIPAAEDSSTQLAAAATIKEHVYNDAFDTTHSANNKRTSTVQLNYADREVFPLAIAHFKTISAPAGVAADTASQQGVADGLAEAQAKVEAVSNDVLDADAKESVDQANEELTELDEELKQIYYSFLGPDCRNLTAAANQLQTESIPIIDTVSAMVRKFEAFTEYDFSKVALSERAFIVEALGNSIEKMKRLLCIVQANSKSDMILLEKFELSASIASNKLTLKRVLKEANQLREAEASKKPKPKNGSGSGKGKAAAAAKPKKGTKAKAKAKAKAKTKASSSDDDSDDDSDEDDEDEDDDSSDDEEEKELKKRLKEVRARKRKRRLRAQLKAAQEPSDSDSSDGADEDVDIDFSPPPAKKKMKGGK